MADHIAAPRNELKQMVIDAVREASLYARLDDLTIPPPCDPKAEADLLAAFLNGVIEKPFHGLESRHFMSEVNQELFARCHLPWDQVRQAISGEGATVETLFELLKANCGPYAPGELSELAYRVKELYEQRKLIDLFRKLELELRFGKIQVCDAEHVLQEHLLRDNDGP